MMAKKRSKNKDEDEVADDKYVSTNIDIQATKEKLNTVGLSLLKEVVALAENKMSLNFTYKNGEFLVAPIGKCLVQVRQRAAEIRCLSDDKIIAVDFESEFLRPFDKRVEQLLSRGLQHLAHVIDLEPGRCLFS